MVQRKRWSRSIVSLCSLGIAGVLALVVAGASVAASVNAASSPLMDCGQGVPLVKCNPSLYVPAPGLAAQPKPQAKVFPSPAAPEIITCGKAFFDQPTVEQLTQQFGALDCFRMVGTPRWIVAGDGMSLTASPFGASPGGAIVAVLACKTDDSACLDPSSQHEFGDFTVSYPPDPGSGRSNLQSIEQGRFVMIANGGCGLFAFDTVSLAWYGNGQTIRDSVVAGQRVSPIKVPVTVKGSAALSQSAPTSTGDCQPIVGQ